MPAMLIRSFLFWAAVIACLSYWPVATALPYYERHIVLNALRLCVAAAVVVAYAPVWAEALLTSRMDRVQQLSLGIGCTWMAVIGSGIWAGVWLLSGQPGWMLEHPINGFWHWLTVIGGILHVTAPRALDGRVPMRSWLLAGIAIGTALLLVITILLHAHGGIPEPGTLYPEMQPSETPHTP